MSLFSTYAQVMFLDLSKKLSTEVSFEGYESFYKHNMINREPASHSLIARDVLNSTFEF